MSIVKESRKVYMMKWSYGAITLLTIVYLLICSQQNVSPDATVMMIVFGALGGGHATANLANGQEHKAKGNATST